MKEEEGAMLLTKGMYILYFNIKKEKYNINNTVSMKSKYVISKSK